MIMFRRSLKLKISLLLFMLMVILLIGGMIFNSLYAEKYYTDSRIKALSNTYDKLNKCLGNSKLIYGSDTYDDVEKLENSTNAYIYVMSVTSSLFGGQELNFEYPMSLKLSESYNSNHYGVRYERIAYALRLYMYGSVEDEAEPELLKTKHECYDIYKMFDVRTSTDFIDLVGYSDSGYLVFIRMNYANISENAGISNTLFSLCGIIVLIIGSVGIFLFSRSIEKPLKNLTHITDEVARLNFSSKYDENRSDVIGELGHNINIMSDKLEQTITNLKSANVRLEQDIENRNRIDEMRRDFVSNISHELKTPLSLIQGYAEGLADDVNDDPESRSFYCEVIIDETLKLNKMVRKLLDLTEIEFGKSKVQMSRFDLVELAHEVVMSFDIISRQKNINVVFNETNPVYVWADRYMTEEVITNYLSNAFNYVSGSNVVDISFKTDDDKVRLSVFNTGSNIPEDMLDKIWDKFFKVDKARTREYGGSGIGLSIVKAIMELHHGAYGAINHSAGIEFWFELSIKADV